MAVVMSWWFLKFVNTKKLRDLRVLRGKKVV